MRSFVILPLIVILAPVSIASNVPSARIQIEKDNAKRHLEPENWIDITYDDFESDLGNFETFGNDAAQSTFREAKFAHQGIYALRIRDNEEESSNAALKVDHDVTSYSNLRIEFWFNARGLEDGEGFFLEYSSDSGSSWTTVQHFVSGRDFQSDLPYKQGFTFISVDFGEKITLELTSRARIRFRCDGSRNDDRVYIDQVRFQGLSSDPITPTQPPAPTHRPTPLPASKYCRHSNIPTFSDSVTPQTLIKFYAMGDIPYSTMERYCLNYALRELDLTSPDSPSFVVHLGDIRKSKKKRPCNEETYNDIGEIFTNKVNRLRYDPRDVLWVVGDNEWVDCPDPDEAWHRYMKHFGPDNPYKFGELTSGVEVHRQKGVYRQFESNYFERLENFAFFRDSVLFVGVNNVGGSAQGDEASRVAQNFDWVRDQLKIYAAKQMKAVVIFGHASMGNERKKHFGDPLIKLLKASYPYLPVLHLHGDTHFFCITRPDDDLHYLVEASVDDAADAPPVIVSVIRNPADDSVTFQIDERGGKYDGGCPLINETTWDEPPPKTRPSKPSPSPTMQPANEVAFINEFHYDNAGTDINEFVEVAFTTGLDLSTYRLEFYKGGNGKAYRTEPLSSCKAVSVTNGLSFCHVNGGPFLNGNNGGHGIALVGPSDTVLQFLSYEGTFVANDAAAKGMTSTNIGVKERSNSPAGMSLQLRGKGCAYEDFTWQRPRKQTMGAVNVNQVISC